jgi:hypothetical protein
MARSLLPGEDEETVAEVNLTLTSRRSRAVRGRRGAGRGGRPGRQPRGARSAPAAGHHLGSAAAPAADPPSLPPCLPAPRPPAPQRGVAFPTVVVSDGQVDKALAECVPVATLSPGARPTWGAGDGGGGGGGFAGVLRRAARLAQLKWVLRGREGGAGGAAQRQERQRRRARRDTCSTSTWHAAARARPFPPCCPSKPPRRRLGVPLPWPLAPPAPRGARPPPARVAWHAQRQWLAVCHPAGDAVLIYDLDAAPSDSAPERADSASLVLLHELQRGAAAAAWRPVHCSMLAVGARGGALLWALGRPPVGGAGFQRAALGGGDGGGRAAWAAFLPYADGCRCGRGAAGGG